MPSDVPDADLLARWCDGDRASGTELMRRHYDRVCRFFSVRVPDVAEDLTQQTFLRCTDNVARLREASGFRSFLFGIARHLLIDHLRRKSVEARLFEFDEPDDRVANSPGPTVSRIVAMHEEQQLLLRALSMLSADAQMAVHLFYGEGLTNREIGEVLDMPTSTVTTRLARARAQLRAEIEQMHATEAFRTSLLGELERWATSLGGLRVERVT